MGLASAHADIAETIAWLTAGVRSSSFEQLCLSRSSIESEISLNNSASFTVKAEQLELIKDDTMCWFSLFPYASLAVQYPVAERLMGVGLELSMRLMLILAGIIMAINHKDGLVLRGLSTILLPSQEVEADKSIQWHLFVSESPNGSESMEFLGGDEELNFFKVKDVTRLLSCEKAYLGWCRSANVLLGTRNSSLDEVGWSQKISGHRMIEFSGFSIGLASGGMGFGGPSANLNFGIARRSRTRYMDIEQELGDRLKFSIVKPCLLYDTSTQRGWLVPTACVLLHMMQLRLRELSKMENGPDAVKKDLDRMPYSDLVDESGLSAFKILSENLHENSKTSLGSAEIWRESLARLFIVLDKTSKDSTDLRDKPSAQEELQIYGFELLDVVTAESPFRFNHRVIKKQSSGWGTIARHVGQVLFCSGLGDVLVPGEGSNKLCTVSSSLDTPCTPLIQLFLDVSEFFRSTISRTWPEKNAS